MSKWLAAFSALVVLAFAGCQASTVEAPPTLFASLRVMDFAQYPAANVDVYWYPGEPRTAPLTTTDANIHGLSYGGGAVYTNGIAAAPGGTKYHYVVTRVNSPEVEESKGDITLYPDQSNTLVITAQPNGSAVDFSSFALTDAKKGTVSNASEVSAKSTFVRLMNLQANSGKLVLHVNDPVTGEVIGSVSGSNGVDYAQASDYYALKTAQDTSYALFLTPASSSDVLAKITYQTYTAGSYFTVVYSGDTNRIPGDLAKADTAQSKLDRVRLRVFPDDNVGADQTNPLDSSFRYNVINGLYYANGYYNGISTLGLTINGDAVPYRHAFTLYPVDMFAPGGSNPHLLDDGVWDVHFYSTSIPTHSIGVVGGVVDADNKTHAFFDLSGANGIPQTNLRADTTISILLLNNSVASKRPPLTVGIPTKVAADSAMIVFVNAISVPNGGPDARSTFSVTGGYTYDGDPLNIGNEDIVTIPASAGQITISDILGNGSTAAPGSTVSFTPEAGGIYEVVSVGVRPGLGGPNKILVILTNKNEPK